MADPIDPLIILPQIAAELTAYRSLVATLKELTRDNYARPSDMVARLKNAVERNAADTERAQKTVRAIASAAGSPDANDEALIAWARESAALRKTIREGA